MQKAANIMELRELLQFFKAAGLTDAVQDAPLNAFTMAEQQLKARPAADGKPAPARLRTDRPAAENSSKPAANNGGNISISRPQPRGSPASYIEWLARAKEQAQSAQTLAELKARIAAFDGCALKWTAKNTCIADGTLPRPLMLVGEGPGAEEDRQALPFVGRAGQLLNRMLAAIGFGRESLQQTALQQAARDNQAAAPAKPILPLAYITNAVFWRPPGNRTPTLPEIDLCRPFLARQIELVRPKILISLGGVAATALLGQKQSILRLRGQWQIYKTADGQEIPYMPSLHPAFLLRSPGQKKAAWQDFLAAFMRLEELDSK
ncbi:uracil-DNA glycosylase [Candidatus Tokpelaia sp.]|uniref:uracil-DNA glycosylase n=1 Tax=Candidatus Tokpelaia sp. TaxID=2233777 RepID=UPI00123AB12A|nr:uracil-DNA glycosylase [Candidatus Tokpelaia sp.]KAA6405929.1 uracil-DNA glycosylase [Candidatus Tokpelaia sp.]